ncbi:MAG TPA: SDR family oxidoreductase, partial [Chondromyces sp.]|nr:SDR family oxidoreductase [Chondromyces sp.]
AEEIQVDEWEKAVAVNASALLYISQLVFPHMKSTGYGRIYGISSRGSKKGIPRYIGIGSAKAAMESIVRYLATEWGPYGICANTISPGVMDTEAFRSVFPDADKRIEYTKRKAPLGQIVQLEDVAELLLQLSRPEMSMITGQDIIMDGGYSLIT